MIVGVSEAVGQQEKRSTQFFQERSESEIDELLSSKEAKSSDLSGNEG
jgi:hypothetical protein